MAEPQTTREMLLAEILGDVNLAIDRIENLKQDLPIIAENAARQVGQSAKKASDDITISANQAKEGITHNVEALEKRLKKAQTSLNDAVEAMGANSTKNLLYGLLIGLMGGVAGGIMVALLPGLLS